jgi:hypothetical protein
MGYTIKHVGDGKFQTIMHKNGEIKECGEQLICAIKRTYSDDFSNLPIGWEVTQHKLIEDFKPTLKKEILFKNNQIAI